MILNTIVQDFKFVLQAHNEVAFQWVFNIFSFPSKKSGVEFPTF
jgi:hypothetical protein